MLHTSKFSFKTFCKTSSCPANLTVEPDAAPQPSHRDILHQHVASIFPSKSLPIRGLTKRRSSDLTVGVVHSPKFLPEGLKTDEEDFSGRSSTRFPGGGIGRSSTIRVEGEADPISLMVPAAPAPADQQHLNATAAVEERADVEVKRESVAEQNRTQRLLLSRYEDANDNITRMESFHLPGERGEVQQQEGGASGLTEFDDKLGGGNDDGVGGWEGDSEGALTDAETAAATALRGFLERPGGSTEIFQRGDGEGLAGGGSFLEAYREPDGHDWAELEDWQGLPGLGFAGGRGGTGIGSRLQVSLFLLHGCGFVCKRER